MNLFRQKRRLLALIGAAVLLFAQLAMAAHACMVMQPAQAVSAAAAMESGPPCHDADPGEPNACLTHCQAGLQQSFDSQPGSSFLVMPVIAFITDRHDLLPAALSARAHTRAFFARVTAPPATVRNCCLRI